MCTVFCRIKKKRILFTGRKSGVLILGLCPSVCWGIFLVPFIFFLPQIEGNMEDVEEANRAAVESCHWVLSIMYQPRNEVHCRNLMVETAGAIVRFKKVVSLLNSGLGHARVRKHKKLQIPFSESILLDNQICKTDHHSKCLEFPHTSFTENSIQGLGQTVRNSIYMMGKLSLELSSNERSPLNLTRQTSWTHYHFLQQQQMKHEAEIMFRRNNSVVNLNFDNSSWTPSMSSSTRSFISSLSIDGSVANMDGNGSAFHLLGAAHFSY